MTWKKHKEGFIYKYRYGYKTLKFQHHPENQVAPKWSLHFFDTGSGSGNLIGRFETKTKALTFARAWMKTHPSR